jgi:simple sugar transport system ATP-binding protein
MPRHFPEEVGVTTQPAESDAPVPEGSPPVLAARNIVKTYGGVTALDGVTFEARSGHVHCLVGENGCGKSTLIKIISGAERPDSGSILIDGREYTHMTPSEAIRAGIQVIYQDFSLFPNLTVAENIILTSQVADRRRLFSAASTRPRAEAIVEELDLDIDLDARVESLSVANRQLTAICRALISDAKVIFMDEPTTALTHTEVTSLFALVERLRERNVALVFVTHKLEEAIEVSQDLTVLRSGRLVVSGPAADFDRRSIMRHMTGRDVVETRHLNDFDEGADPRLSVEGLSLGGAFRDVSFDVRPGEILGITGLLGSGRSEIMESLFGIYPATSGTVKVDGRPVRINGIKDAIEAGFGYVPADRLTEGLFLEKSIADNTISASLERHRTWGVFTDRAKVARTIDRFFTALRIKAPDVMAPVRSLSGGNAQRVALAKWLANDPKVLMLNGPTVGVDVGSKEEILSILRAEAEHGMSIVIVSDDVPELAAVCHRVLVVRRGAVVQELVGDQVNVSVIEEGLAA